MTKNRLDGLVLLLLGAAIFLLVGLALKRVSPISSGDFKVVYYPTRCLLQHGDPYLQSDVVRVYQAEGRELPSESALNRQVMTQYFYPPTSFLVTLPFALLGYGPGHVLWMIVSAGSLILAAFLMFDLVADFAPLLSGALLGFLLMNSFWLFMIGNSAAIVVSLCAIAVWCFFRERFVPAGILCLALSLALKPHDSGLVLLFFLLAGGTCRKRALQTLLVLAVLCLAPVLGVAHVAPHWIQEAHANMLSFTGPGAITDPAATGMAGRNMDSLVQLQSAVSIFWENPRVYNSITYAVCGALLLVWVFATVRFRQSPARARLALAAVAPLSMLPIYHLQHDAKLLMLTVPACAMLWAEGGRVGRLAVFFTAAGIVINGDIFSFIRIMLTRHFLVPQPNWPSQILTVVLTRPAPLILLSMAVFYLWVYTRLPVVVAASSSLPEKINAHTS
jgi:hypothetical protein